MITNDPIKVVGVSVPSRGLSYLNLEAMKQDVKEYIVSVPSRGLSYLNAKTKSEGVRTMSFRPLTGTLLSKFVNTFF